MKSILAVLLVTLPAPAHTLHWEACGEVPGAECTSITLPADWANPGGEKFDLQVARRPATDQEHRIGTLVFGPGGPWDSGVERVRDNFSRFSTLQSRFDIVSFDPRGSHGSHPVVCDPDLLADPPAPVLTSQADFDATVDYHRRLWKTCRTGTGPLWDHADMLSNVRDLDALRAALGERQISFHGSSYGTLLGEQYAEAYPGRVRAMVLESVDDHSSRSTGEFLTAQAAAYEDAFDDFADWCAAPTTTTCALHDRDVRAVWRGQSSFDLRAVTLKLLKDAKYAQLAAYLTGPPAQLPPLDVVVPAFCNDWKIPVRSYAEYAALLDQAERVAPDTGYPAQVLPLTLCLGWPHVANPQHDLHIRTATPVLLLNSRHDPATGLNWARAVERQLGRHGVLVTYAGAGHGSYTLNGCMKRTADDYLVALTVPPRGTVCPTA
jgi:pimeloyl-ACP methyl ester carboxylesterase